MPHPPTIKTIQAYPIEPKLAYNRTLRIVRGYLHRSFDSEDIAIGILLESWGNSIPHPTRTFIQQRCTDHMRARKRDLLVLSELKPEETTSSDAIDRRDEVSVLVKVLSPLEQKLIWYRFYLDIPMREIAASTKVPLNRVRRVLWVALFKMREVAGRER